MAPPRVALSTSLAPKGARNMAVGRDPPSRASKTRAVPSPHANTRLFGSFADPNSHSRTSPHPESTRKTLVAPPRSRSRVTTKTVPDEVATHAREPSWFRDACVLYGAPSLPLAVLVVLVAHNAAAGIDADADAEA